MPSIHYDDGIGGCLYHQGVVWHLIGHDMAVPLDVEGFTSCEGVKDPLRVLHTLETTRRRERIAGQWQETEETRCWYWATTLSPQQLSTHRLWRAGHGR